MVVLRYTSISSVIRCLKQTEIHSICDYYHVYSGLCLYVVESINHQSDPPASLGCLIEEMGPLRHQLMVTRALQVGILAGRSLDTVL